MGEGKGGKKVTDEYAQNTFYMYECFCLHGCMCTTYVPGDYGSQKRTADSLELELLEWLCATAYRC